MDRREFIARKAHAIVMGDLDKYVVLKEDEKGRYIEYAFKEGAPHDNRCLSWYVTLQPKALKRNGHDIKEWKLCEVGQIYRLLENNCGEGDKKGDEYCAAGYLREKCRSNYPHWTYDEPVKCACWSLWRLEDLGQLSIPLDKVVDYMHELVNLQKEKHES